MNRSSFQDLLLSSSLLLIFVLQVECQPSTENDKIIRNEDNMSYMEKYIDDLRRQYSNPSAQSNFLRIPMVNFLPPVAAPPQENYDNQRFPGMLWQHKTRIPIATYQDLPLSIDNRALSKDNPLHHNSDPKDADFSIFDQPRPSSPTVGPEDTTRPPLPTPKPKVSNCMWAVVNCCQQGSTKIHYSCFEDFGCFGAFWDINPCADGGVLLRS